MRVLCMGIRAIGISRRHNLRHRSGQVKVLDFGIGKLSGERSDDDQ